MMQSAAASDFASRDSLAVEKGQWWKNFFYALEKFTKTKNLENRWGKIFCGFEIEEENWNGKCAIFDYLKRNLGLRVKGHKKGT